MSNQKGSPYSELNDGLWLEKRYTDEHFCCSKIAKEVGCAPCTVLAALNRHKIQRRTPGEGHRKYKELEDIKWLEKRYLEERLSAREISGLVGCSSSSVDNALKRLGIVARNHSEARIQYAVLYDKEWLEEKYVNDRLSCSKIGGIVGCTPSAVQYVLKRFSIPLRVPIEAHHKHVGEDGRVLLESMYIDERKSAQEIGERFRCSSPCILNTLRRFGIPLRSRSEACERNSIYAELNDRE